MLHLKLNKEPDLPSNTEGLMYIDDYNYYAMITLRLLIQLAISLNGKLIKEKM